MKFKDLIAVSGKGGLFEMVTARQDGLILKPLGEDSKSFVSSRKHNFTPLENIGVYLQSGDTVELKEVLEIIKGMGETYPTASSSPVELREFFRMVLPEHDEDKVRLSDMKKIMQWYDQLKNTGWFENNEEE